MDYFVDSVFLVVLILYFLGRECQLSQQEYPRKHGPTFLTRKTNWDKPRLIQWAEAHNQAPSWLLSRTPRSHTRTRSLAQPNEEALAAGDACLAGEKPPIGHPDPPPRQISCAPALLHSPTTGYCCTASPIRHLRDSALLGDWRRRTRLRC